MALVFVVLIVLVLVIFSIQNAAILTVSFFHWRFEASFAVIIFFAVLSGVLVVQLMRRWITKELAEKEKRSRRA